MQFEYRWRTELWQGLKGQVQLFPCDLHCALVYEGQNWIKHSFQRQFDSECSIRAGLPDNSAVEEAGKTVLTVQDKPEKMQLWTLHRIFLFFIRRSGHTCCTTQRGNHSSDRFFSASPITMEYLTPGWPFLLWTTSAT